MIWFAEDRWFLCIPRNHPKGGVFHPPPHPAPIPKHAEFFQPGKETVFEKKEFCICNNFRKGLVPCPQYLRLLKWCKPSYSWTAAENPFGYPEIIRPPQKEGYDQLCPSQHLSPQNATKPKNFLPLPHLPDSTAALRGLACHRWGWAGDEEASACS